MFTIKQWVKNRYVVISSHNSRGKMAIALHHLTNAGKVKVYDRKGKEILTGRMVANGDRVEFKAG